MSRTFFMASLAFCAFLAGVAASQAQPATPGNAVGRRAALSSVATACREDYARLCPSDTNLVPTPRDEVICLRPLKADLSLHCRHAVSSAAR